MPKFKFEEIEEQLTKGRLYPVYLIYGPEQYLIRILTDKVREVYHAETGAEIERHSAKGLDAVSVIDSLKTLPMWSRGKMVIVGEAESLTEKAKELFQSYAESKSASTVLVLTASKFDGRSRLYKAFSENGAAVEVSAIYENRMPFWINRECMARGYKISHEAAHFMTELVGTNLSAMADAVERLALYVGGKKIISLTDVEAVLSDTSQKSIFDLTNAVGSKDLARASDRLINLLRNNEPAVVIMTMLARHFRLLFRAKELLSKGAVSEQAIAKALGVHPFFVREYISQSKKFTKKSLATGLKKLWQADMAIKSSRMSDDAILHNLLIEMIGPLAAT